MSGKPTTSCERIIPIQLEYDDSIIQSSQEDPPTEKPEVTNEDSSPEQYDTPLPDAPIKRILPMINVQEKIVFIIDCAEDEKFTPFLLNKTQNRSLEMLKRAVEMFLQNKTQIDNKHEYALAVLNENSVVWLVDFTNNIKKILKVLEEVESCEPEDIFELNSLFQILSEKVKIPEVCEEEEVILPPPYVVRVILLYGRSYTMPRIEENDEMLRLLEAPFFTLDVLMTHEPVDKSNNCNKIFNVLQKLDQKGFAYFFSVERDARNLFKSMGRLLGHPLQRPVLKWVG